MTYAESLSYLDTFLNYEKVRLNANLPRAFNLRRMERLLAAMDAPHRNIPTLHVAGTKGKGSTCAFLESVLREAGYRTGLYTSPHLISPRERLRVNGKRVSEEGFADLTARLQPILESHRETDDGRLTFFEVYTAMAFQHFAESKVEVSVLEVGMGGRLDATNVIQPVATAITSVGIDHVAVLGNTLGEIASEKAGIIKAGCPLILAPQEPSARRVILRVAEERDAPVTEVGMDISLQRVGIRDGREVADFKWKGGRLDGVCLRLLGAHQSVNAATALGVLLKLRQMGWNLPDDRIRAGLETATLPGRFQIVPLPVACCLLPVSNEDPHRNSKLKTLILDGAHTGESAEALRQTLTETFGGEKFTLVVGMSSDKEMERFAAALAPIASRVILTRTSNSPRAAEPDLLVSVWRNHLTDVTTAPSVREAVTIASTPALPSPTDGGGTSNSPSPNLGEGRAGEPICVTGSLYLVGEALATVTPEACAVFQDEVNL